MNDKIDENITYKTGDKLVVKGTVYKFLHFHLLIHH